jgi:hypothetical protein
LSSASTYLRKIRWRFSVVSTELITGGRHSPAGNRWLRGGPMTKVEVAYEESMDLARVQDALGRA